MFFFLFPFIPFNCSSPHTAIFFQPQTSNPNMTATGFLMWIGMLLSSPSLPSPCISPTLTTLLVPSAIFPIAPLSSCLRGHILLNSLNFLKLCFSSLRLQHSTENTEKRACSHQASQQCWLDVFQCSYSQHWRL